ncbi:VTC domain-containing protein [Demequina capsici]|uniref:VTC domain-containing protein n=1 Tax=Demequina capsici TaxID=3075620 RepID=A0AA96F7P5_9MICO|nr:MULTISPECIES: VTC domain-containing protein [unclassified Demequina]WNM24317.1 VTC domain-containing protein [Demequina sp. OYTSA14]WNM27139.1 VTC domain-containing protein [Demequina sp. PMTSA13]
MTLVTPWEAYVGTLPAISLEQIETTAAMLTRVDRKYVVEPGHWAEVVASLDVPVQVLEIDGRRSFRYESVYLDTDDLQMYRDAARRRPRRTKVRTRHYLDTGASAIEVKERSASGSTVKSRLFLDSRPDVAEGLTSEALDFVGGFPRLADVAASLRPSLTTTYVRTTLVTPDGRVTVDAGVEAHDVDGRSIAYDHRLIVETKVSHHAGAVDRTLWARGIRPARVSKYCTSMAALRPDLPSNRWARTLRRHVDAPALAS